jgi:hypothetical protein
MGNFCSKALRGPDWVSATSRDKGYWNCAQNAPVPIAFPVFASHQPIPSPCGKESGDHVWQRLWLLTSVVKGRLQIIRICSRATLAAYGASSPVETIALMIW